VTLKVLGYLYTGKSTRSTILFFDIKLHIKQYGNYIEIDIVKKYGQRG